MTTKTAHDKHEAEQRKLHEDNVKRHLAYHPSEVHAEVEALKGVPVEIHAAGGQVFLNSHGEKAFEREGWIQFRKQVEAAFQVVA